MAALLLSAALATTGTLAYLTDTDSDVNVMTLGNVQIDQIELQRAEGVAHNATAKDGDLVPFVQGQPLYPAYTDDVSDYSAKLSDDEQFWWGPYVTADLTHPDGASNGLFDDGLKGALDKFVFVKNTGSSPAFYRTWIALECPECLRYDGDSVDKADLWINANSNNRFEWEVGDYQEIEGVRYLILCATYLKELPAGEISRPSLLQVALTHTADNEDMEALGDTYEILALTQAVQTNNMPDAKTALNAAFGEATIENHPWKSAATPEIMLEQLLKGEGGTILAKEDVEMIIESEDAIALDAKGATVVMNGTGTAPGESYDYGYLGFVPPAGEDVTISNLTVTGAGFVEMGHYGTSTKGTYVANNLVVKDMIATLNINNGGNNIAGAFSHYGTATLNDCVMVGTTTLKEGYKPYDAAFVNGTKTEINGGEYGYIYLANQAHVTIKDAKVGAIDSYAITARNLGKLTIGAGAEVGKIYVDAPGSYKPALVIEDGATVGEIIYKGDSYTAAEWMAANP